MPLGDESIESAEKTVVSPSPSVWPTWMEAAITPLPSESEDTYVPESLIPKSRGGQSGSKIYLPKDKLSSKEALVVQALMAEVNPLPLNALAFLCFPDEARGNSWVRNSLRRLVRGEWVDRVGPGTYRMTEWGRTAWSQETSADAQ